MKEVEEQFKKKFLNKNLMRKLTKQQTRILRKSVDNIGESDMLFMQGLLELENEGFIVKKDGTSIAKRHGFDPRDPVSREKYKHE